MTRLQRTVLSDTPGAFNVQFDTQKLASHSFDYMLLAAHVAAVCIR